MAWIPEDRLKICFQIRKSSKILKSIFEKGEEPEVEAVDFVEPAPAVRAANAAAISIGRTAECFLFVFACFFLGIALGSPLPPARKKNPAAFREESAINKHAHTKYEHSVGG